MKIFPDNFKPIPFFVIGGLMSLLMYGFHLVENEWNDKYIEITQEIKTLKTLDGKFKFIDDKLEFHKFAWLATRVDLDRPHQEWEADAKKLLIKNGWKPHPSAGNSLCKNGIKTTFEMIPYQGKEYEVMTMLYDTVTKSKEECNYPHNEFLNWLR